MKLSREQFEIVRSAIYNAVKERERHKLCSAMDLVNEQLAISEALISEKAKAENASNVKLIKELTSHIRAVIQTGGATGGLGALVKDTLIGHSHSVERILHELSAIERAVDNPERLYQPADSSNTLPRLLQDAYEKAARRFNEGFYQREVTDALAIISLQDEKSALKVLHSYGVTLPAPPTKKPTTKS